MKTLTSGREVKRGGRRSSAPCCLEFLAAAHCSTVQEPSSALHAVPESFPALLWTCFVAIFVISNYLM